MNKTPSKDTLWKAIIEDLSIDFLGFFFPDLLDQIDLDQQFIFLDKELDKLYPEQENVKNRRADKLIQVFLNSGLSDYIFVHIEVQGYNDAEFSKRMLQMCFRIYERFGNMPHPLVIYTDTSAEFRVDNFWYRNTSMELIYRFKTFSISEQEIKVFIENNNVFAIILETAWYDLKKKNWKDKELLQLKNKILRRLASLNFPRKKIENILTFVKYYTCFENHENYNNFENTVIKYNQPMGIQEAVLNFFKEQALEEGLEQGDYNRTLISVRNMSVHGLSVPNIALYLGITEAQVEEFLEDIKELEGKGQ